MGCALRTEVASSSTPPERRCQTLRPSWGPCATTKAAPNYLDRRGRPREKDDLKGHDWVSLKERPSRDRPLRKPSDGRELVLDDLTAAHQAVVAGLGVSYLPAYLCQAGLEAGALETVAEASTRIEVPVYTVYPQRNYLPASHTAFMEHVRAVLAAQRGPLTLAP